MVALTLRLEIGAAAQVGGAPEAWHGERAVMGKKLEFAIAILNGAVGDHLARTNNGLATTMSLVWNGRELPLTREALAGAYPSASGKLALFVHGLMCTEDVWQPPNGDDYGSLLARDLGFSSLYLRYNSGRAIAENGAALADLIARLVELWPAPVNELVLVGYSMGGLVVRSACHFADGRAHAWLGHVRCAIYVGTPHLGAPMERVGRVVGKVLGSIDDPYTKLIAELADLRSDGLKDLGDADLRDEDRARRVPCLNLRDPRHPVPLLAGIDHYLVAGALSTDPRLALLFGDAMVPLASATDGVCADAASFALPLDHVKIVHGASHRTLPCEPRVYEHLRAWCARDRDA